MPLEYEPFSTCFRDDPYPVYRELRDHAPVHWAPESGMFCVSHYEDVCAVLRQPELFSSAAMAQVLQGADMAGRFRFRWVMLLASFFWKTRLNPLRITSGNLVSFDPPRHDAMRAIVNRGFTPRRIAAWEPRIRELADGCLAKLRRGEGFDVIADLAVPIPVTVIAEMLGVEPDRLADFKRWTDAIVAVASGTARENPFESGLLDHFGDLFLYLRDRIRARRSVPSDDLMSVLIDPAHGDVLDEFDAILFVVLLLVAGSETTTNLIGNAVNALLAHPETLAFAAADPSLMPRLLEETLRYDSPIQMVFRTALRETEIAGVRIPKGATLAPLLGSANRDERRFPEPDIFDPSRDTRGHVAFGNGIHFCLGASLARLEGRLGKVCRSHLGMVEHRLGVMGMKKQQTFASVAWNRKGKVTRRERFLAEMDAVIPWSRLVALIEPHYPSTGKGRPPHDLERMLRIYFLQHWFNLSDPQAEDAIYDSESMRRFARVELGDDKIPDESTILRFRHRLEQHGLTAAIFEAVKDLLAEHRLTLRAGTIVDATIIAAPSSTKNATRTRDPEMKQTRKGKNWHFGMKLHIGTDRRGIVHSVTATHAAESDIKQLLHLLHGEETVLYGDQAYWKEADRQAFEEQGVRYRVNRRAPGGNKNLSERWRKINRARSRTRARCEHPFRVIKQLWGFQKVRYRGIAKNLARAQTMFALANLYAVRRRLLPPEEECVL